MAILNRMRNHMAIVLWILVFAFLGLIVFEWGMGAYPGIFGGPSQHIGSIDGKNVSVEEYQFYVKNLTDNYRQQNKIEDIDPYLEKMIQDEAWNQLVYRELSQKAIKQAGLSVTDQEIYDWVTGPNPPQVIRQQFTDESGQINRANLEQAMSNAQNRQVWLQVDRMLREQRLSEKYQALMSSLITVSPSEVLHKFTSDNSRVTANYIFFNPDHVADSLVTVSDSDIEKFYEKNKDEFKKKETRKVRYVEFNTLATKEDSASVLAEVDKLTQEFSVAFNDSLFVSRHSEKPYTSAWFSRGEISDPKEIVFDMAKGAIIPVRDQDGMYIIKATDSRKGTETKYRARHILIKPSGNTKADTLKAMDRIKELRKDIETSKEPLAVAFGIVATLFSQDGSAQNGGDLGWFKDGAMVKPFEEAVKKGKVGTVVGPVKTQFGAHLIYITAKDDTQMRLSEVYKSFRPSGATIRKAKTNAEDFIFMAQEDGFAAEAQKRSVQVKESPLIEKRAAIPGLTFNSRLSDWMFNAKVGGISDAIDLGNSILVAELVDISAEGFQPLDDQLKASLKFRVLREKKIEYQFNRANTIGKEIGSNLPAAAAKDVNLTVKTTDDFNMNGSPAGVGRDLIFVGQAFKLDKGQVSAPFKGTRGVYILEVVNKTEPDVSRFESQKTMIENQIRDQKQKDLQNGWVEALKSSSKIEDNRSTFGY